MYVMSLKKLCDGCGALIKGTTEKHLKSNINLHKKNSRKHREIIKLKEENKK